MTTKSPTRFLATLLATAAAEVALLTAGTGGRLTGPDLRDPASWPTWLLTRPPDVAVMALVRWAALVVGAYLLVVIAVGGLGRTAGSPWLVRATDRVTPPSLRLFLDRVTGMAAVGAVVVSGLAGSTGVAAADPGGGPPTTRHGPPITLRGQAGPRPAPLPTTTTTVWLPSPAPIVDEPVAPPTPGSHVPGDTPPEVARPTAPYGTPWKPDRPPSPPPSPQVQPPPPPSPTASPPERGAYEGTAPRSSSEDAPPADGAQPPAPAADADASAAADADTWAVAPGDHFWSIAERVLAERWGRRPTTLETDGYWRALVAANRTRLADRDNPDLLFPGQVLTLPPAPARPAA